MNFDLSADQKSIRDTVASLLADQLNPAEALRRSDAGVLDTAVWDDLRKMELGGVLVSEEQGGASLGLVTLAAITEKLGAYCAAAPLATNALAAWLVAEAGSDEQRAQWLEGLISGEKVAAFALSEGEGGWLPESWTLAGPEISGTKTYVEWGSDAQLLIVGLADGNLALVSANAPGVSIVPVDSLDRTRPLATVTFAGTSADTLPKGANFLEKLVDARLVLLAADAWGAAAASQVMAVEYAKTRVQFGQPIGQFQAIKHQLANNTIEIEPALPLLWYAALAWDSRPDEQRHAAAMVKAHIGDLAVRTIRSSLEVHGGIGYTWEFPMHVWLKRAMFDSMYMGSPSLHRARAAELSGW